MARPTITAVNLIGTAGLVALVAFMLASCYAVEYPRFEPARDTLDPAPAWYQGELRDAALDFLRHDPARHDDSPTVRTTFASIGSDSTGLDAHVHLLAWYDFSVEQDRGDRTSHSALLRISFRRPGSEERSWALLLMNAESTSPVSGAARWHILTRYHHPDPVSIRYFDSAPAGRHVASFLIGWDWDPDNVRRGDFTTFKGVVRENTWRALTGSDPVALFE